MAEKVFPAIESSFDDAMDFMREEAEKAGASIRTVTQLELAFEEAYINVAHYAYPAHDGDIRVSVNPTEGSLRIVIRDSGIPFDPLAKEDPDVTLPAEQRKIGGLGIFMVKKIMDSVEYQYDDGDNVLIMEKKL